MGRTLCTVPPSIAVVLPQRHLPGKSLKPFSSPPMRRAIFLYPEGGKPVNEPMTFLDFFSGVGGFRKGFELCGMVCKGHCEIDKFADRSYRAIHDIQEDEWYGEDITKTEPNHLPRVNLWAGGFPCQDISVSGRQRGLAGKRSSLFFEIIRLLKGTPAEDRPEWLVLENVKNLLSVNRGWDFATVLHSLAEIGYHIPPPSRRMWNTCWIPCRRARCSPIRSSLSCSIRRFPTVPSSRSS